MVKIYQATIVKQLLCTTPVLKDVMCFNVGLIANLTNEISWFKYVGNITLDCASKAHEMPTLMEAVETLHDCLEKAHQVIHKTCQTCS